MRKYFAMYIITFKFTEKEDTNMLINIAIQHSPKCKMKLKATALLSLKMFNEIKSDCFTFTQSN